ncbi:MAG: hypothetical protein KAH20_13300 [Methylococcales bacterium]|nr:hypothetical protein [Methylococcales bacterium]
MDEADKSLEAYDKLNNNVPSIGFLSRKKRVIAYLKVTKFAQQLIDDKELSQENVLYLLSTLARKNASFQKAAMMVALNLSSIDRKLIQSVGFKYANDMRCNLHMTPIDEDINKP